MKTLKENQMETLSKSKFGKFQKSIFHVGELVNGGAKAGGSTYTSSKETKESTFDSDSACGTSCERDAGKIGFARGFATLSFCRSGFRSRFRSSFRPKRFYKF